VELQRITKRFGSVLACDRVDLTLRQGEVHGILGENGAGKSTLMKILIGLVLPDDGRVDVRGRAVHIHDPLVAADLGIAMVHQHYSLVDPLSVWENVVLGEPARLDPSAARARVREIGERYGLDVDPDARVGSLTAGQRQRVEIVKCLRRDPTILVFDEPTSVLTPAESEQLFSVLRRVVAEEGRTVALVSHKLDEVLQATDVISIMRQGRVVEHLPAAEADARTLARAMVGREVSLRAEAAAFGLAEAVEGAAAAGATGLTGFGVQGRATPVLQIRGASVRGRDGAPKLVGLDLTVGPGEIVGVAGVEGNGQRELADVLSSLLKLDEGTVEVVGVAVATGRPGAMAAAGVGVIPEDRHDSGCVLGMTVAENLAMADPHVVARRGLLDRRALRRRAARLMSEFEITAPGPDTPMRLLSGGNQQRVVLARELSASPTVLVAAQPTHGLDVGAIEYMGGRLRAAAESGVGVLLISNELEEILALAHRIVVVHRGRVVGEMSRAEADLERIGLLMGGAAA
jgi:simple sugar transport system ATP-binding protein